jgi:glycosyltransferase involved in cell wall biosynthesis
LGDQSSKSLETLSGVSSARADADAKPASRQTIRIAHLVSHPVQYLVPIYREITRMPGVELTVYYYSDSSLGRHFDEEFGAEFEWSTPLLGGYQHRFFPSSRGKPNLQPLQRPNWDLLAAVAKEKYDMIWINSYIGVNALVARTTALFHGTPVFFRDDTNLLTPRPWWKRALKNVVLRSFLRGTWALYVGEESKRYWKHYGLPASRLFFSPHCVDNTYWSEKATELRSRRDELRRSFGIDDDAPVILYCAKFIPKKQPLLMLSAFKLARQKVKCWLLMAGDGQMRGQVQEMLKSEDIPNVIMPGFMNQDQLPSAYAAADLFVLPSAFNETWGLVVNEAMNFSLPVIVSDQVGCGKDLVRPGWNGFVFDHTNERELADRMVDLAQDAQLRKTFGANSARLVTEYSVSHCAEGIVQAGRAAGEG